MAVTRNAETDGGITVTYPTVTSSVGPRHEARVSARCYPGDRTHLTVTDVGPRGAEVEVPVVLDPVATQALRVELRPVVNERIVFAVPGTVARESADARARLDAITAAVELLGQADGRELAAVRAILAEVGLLLADAVAHAVPAKVLAKAGERFR